MEKKRYGLFTAVTMIVGIVIGSGIFFKSDNILYATGGSLPLGVLVFLLGAVGIVFGGLSLSELASRTDRPGGVIAYAREFAGRRMAGVFGWFQTFIYLPAITVVVSWAVGIYACLLFGWGTGLPAEGLLALQLGIGMGFVLADFSLNVLSARLGGWFQNAATVAKLIPLAVFAVLGLVLGDPAEGFRTVAPETVRSAGWLAAIGPIAFSFDGWTVSASISHEIRNPKRNLPIALICAPLFILLSYVLYFVGITAYLGPETVMELGDAHVELAAARLLGPMGAKVLLVFVLVSVMGTVNGLVLGSIRLPFALGTEGLLPGSGRLSREHPTLKMPVWSALLAWIMTLIWSGIHYLTARFHLLPNADVSEIAITVSYVLYLVLYFQVYRLYRRGEIRSRVRGIVVPVLAALGSGVILSGGMQIRMFWPYAVVCAAVMGLAFRYASVHPRMDRP